MTRLLIATLFLALGACAGAIDEPGGGDDNSADATDEPTDETDAPTDEPTDETGEPDAGGDEPGPSFAATVYPIVSNAQTCLNCHKQGGLQSAVDAIDFSGGDAETVYGVVMADQGLVAVGNPDGSKLFNKPTQSNGATHGGGLQFAADSPQGTAIRAWIQGGAEP